MGGDCRLRNKSFFCVFSNDSIVHSMWGGGGGPKENKRRHSKALRKGNIDPHGDMIVKN